MENTGIISLLSRNLRTIEDSLERRGLELLQISKRRGNAGPQYKELRASCRREAARRFELANTIESHCADFGSEETQQLKDHDALQNIQEMLRDPNWAVGMLEDIAEILARTGRETDNYDDEHSTWAQH